MTAVLPPHPRLKMLKDWEFKENQPQPPQSFFFKWVICVLVLCFLALCWLQGHLEPRVGKHSDNLKFDLLPTSTTTIYLKNSLWYSESLWLMKVRALVRFFVLHCFVVAGTQTSRPTFLKQLQQELRGHCTTVIHVIANPEEWRLRRPLSRLQATWRPDSFQTVTEGE